ncbi:MAG TPA: hypothetical protein VFI47_01275, partial [Acidimicrobiales bacterium]|nr:hypothetical protein [Acidimicrobiales bacterium]
MPRVRAARPAAPPRPAAATRRGEDEHREPGAVRILRLQRTSGNRAVGALLRRPVAVQRDVGWPEAKNWNKGAPRTIDAQHRMLRVALAGLPVGNKATSMNTAKSEEKAADETGARAIVWIHPDLDPSKPVQVVTHLHGLTNRSADPFAGWRENNADPSTDESQQAKEAALKAATQEWTKARKTDRSLKRPRLQDMANPLAGKVRDVERDRIGQQVEALGDPQIMAVLPQGTGVSGTQMFGPDFDPDAFVGKVLTRLASEPEVTSAVKKYKVPASYTIVLSAHSAGGAATAAALKAKRTGHLGGLILFDALWGEPSKDDPKKIVSWQRDALLAWVRAGCKGLGAVLREAAPAEAKDRAAYQARMDAAVKALPGVRGFFTGGYARTYAGVQDEMHRIVDQTIPAPYRAAVKAKFRIAAAKTSHDRMLGEVGAASPGVAPLQEALGERNVFVSRQAPAGAAVVQRSVGDTTSGNLAAPAPARAQLQRQPAPPPPPPPARTPAQQVDDAAERVRDAVRAAAAPLVGTANGDDIVGILTQQLIRRRADTSAALRRTNPNHPALPLYAVLYGTDVVADLQTIDTQSLGRRPADKRKAADPVRRRVFQAVLAGLVTDVRPRTAVAAPATPLDRAVQIAGERAMVPAVLPFIASGRTWDDVRVGVITEFGGLVDGTRTALARANAFYGALQAPTFRNVTRATRVHPDLNAAFVRADAMINRRLAATPEPQRTQLATEIATVLGRSTWSAVLRANQNSPHRLSDHSFGFAIDIDSPRNPNIGSRGGLGPVQDVTGDDPTAATTLNRTGAQVEQTATDLRTTSDEYRAAMTSDATLAPVLLRLANEARARVVPPLPALTSGVGLVAAVVLRRKPARDTALRAALWPEGSAAAATPTPAPAPAGRRAGRPPAPPAPPAALV